VSNDSMEKPTPPPMAAPLGCVARVAGAPWLANTFWNGGSRPGHAEAPHPDALTLAISPSKWPASVKLSAEFFCNILGSDGPPAANNTPDEVTFDTGRWVHHCRCCR